MESHNLLAFLDILIEKVNLASKRAHIANQLDLASLLTFPASHDSLQLEFN